MTVELVKSKAKGSKTRTRKGNEVPPTIRIHIRIHIRMNELQEYAIEPIRHTSKPIQQKRDDRSHLPIRERLPLPDLGAMKRMMSNLHKSNQNAEKKEKESCRRKLEVIDSLDCLS